jgi:hypothetical protein
MATSSEHAVATVSSTAMKALSSVYASSAATASSAAAAGGRRFLVLV